MTKNTEMNMKDLEQVNGGDGIIISAERGENFRIKQAVGIRRVVDGRTPSPDFMIPRRPGNTPIKKIPVITEVKDFQDNRNLF
ncbi:MAG: hypothetical protein J5777_07520 [Clostridiales bacterium]|nr:hypothetical protein [Clostridiales bacterium]